MKATLSLFTLRRNLDSLLAAAAGFFIIYLFTRHSGIGISPDSVTYLSAARNWNNGNGLTQFDRTPLIDFPGFYPLFLSFLQLIIRKDPLLFAPVLNSLMYAALIYTSGAMMNGFAIFSRMYKILLLSCIVLSPCLLEVYPMLWSETLFLLILVLFILQLNQYLTTHTLSSLLFTALLAALACVTRYAGVTLLATGGMLIIFDWYLRPYRRLQHLILFSVCSSTPLILNLARNRAVSGFLTGARQKGVTPLMDNIYYYGSVLCDWLPLPKDNHALSVTVGITCLICLGLMTLYILIRHSYAHSPESVALAFVFVYSLFIIISATVSRYQTLNSRLLSPLFIPFLWAISSWVPIFYRRLPGRQRRWLMAIVVLAFLGFQHNQLAQDYETYDGVKDAGVPGYTEDPFPQSQIVQYIRKEADFSKAGYLIYSNAADAVYLFTGHSADLLPQKVFGGQVARFYEEKMHYLVWFNDIDNPDEISLEDVLANKNMVLVRQFPDGAVYVTPDIK